MAAKPYNRAMQATLHEPERANLLAIILHRMLTRSPEPLRPGRYRIRAGGMTARILGHGGEMRVESGEGEADVAIDGSLPVLIRLLLGAGSLRAWFGGGLRWSGSPFRALALLKVLRCRS
jgi:hypothetical protein